MYLTFVTRYFRTSRTVNLDRKKVPFNITNKNTFRNIPVCSQQNR